MLPLSDLGTHGHKHSCLVSVGQSTRSRSDVAICSDAQSWTIAWIRHLLRTRGRLGFRWLRRALAVCLGHFPSISTRRVALICPYAFRDINLLILFSLTVALLSYAELASFFHGRSGAEVVFLEHAYPRPRFFVPITFAISTVLLSCVFSLVISAGSH